MRRMSFTFYLEEFTAVQVPVADLEDAALRLDDGVQEGVHG